MQANDTENGDGDASSFRPFDWMRDVTATEGLTGKATAVAFALVTMQRKGQIDSALMQTVAERAHTTLRSAERGLAELRATGLVKVSGRYGQKGRIASAFTLLQTGAWAASRGVGPRHYGGQVSATMAGRGARHSGGAIQEEKKRMRGLSSVQAQAAKAAELSAHREVAARCEFWHGQAPCSACGTEAPNNCPLKSGGWNE